MALRLCFSLSVLYWPIKFTKHAKVFNLPHPRWAMMAKSESQTQGIVFNHFDSSVLDLRIYSIRFPMMLRSLLQFRFILDRKMMQLWWNGVPFIHSIDACMSNKYLGWALSKYKIASGRSKCLVVPFEVEYALGTMRTASSGSIQRETWRVCVCVAMTQEAAMVWHW